MEYISKFLFVTLGKVQYWGALFAMGIRCLNDREYIHTYYI